MNNKPNDLWDWHKYTHTHSLPHTLTHTATHTHVNTLHVSEIIWQHCDTRSLWSVASLATLGLGHLPHTEKKKETVRERGSETATETDERAIYCFSYLFALEYCLKCDLPLRRRLRLRRPCSPSDSQGRCSLGGSGGTLGELLEQLSSGKSPLPAACCLPPAAAKFLADWALGNQIVNSIKCKRLRGCARAAAHAHTHSHDKGQWPWRSAWHPPLASDPTPVPVPVPVKPDPTSCYDAGTGRCSWGLSKTVFFSFLIFSRISGRSSL